MRFNDKSSKNLNLDVALGEEFDGFEGGPVLPDKAGSSLHETLTVGDHRRDFDDVAEKVVLQHSTGLEMCKISMKFTSF
jgi:hypothetical protein